MLPSMPLPSGSYIARQRKAYQGILEKILDPTPLRETFLRQGSKRASGSMKGHLGRDTPLNWWRRSSNRLSSNRRSSLEEPPDRSCKNSMDGTTAHAVFVKYDVNETGFLSARELKNALHDHGIDLSRAEAISVIRRYDENPDMLLDCAEFTNLVRDLTTASGRLSRVAESSTKDLEDRITPPLASHDFELNPDVYSIMFILLNNATGGMYSGSPIKNHDIRLAWAVFIFVTFSQVFVLVLLILVWPPAVDSSTIFLDCADVASLPAGLSAAACAELDFAFTLPPITEGGHRHTFRKYTTFTYFYQNVLMGGIGHHMLKFVCIAWVTTQIYHKDFRNVASLLEFRDFNRWLLPIKGEEPEQNVYVMLIPAIQYTLSILILSVSCAIIIGTSTAFDIVLNSLAFTFISDVADLFSAPLLKYYSTAAIPNLDPEEYGEEPIYYIVTEYSPDNATPDDYLCSWYILDSQQVAGLITDFHFRHEPGTYPQPNQRTIAVLHFLFFLTPPLIIAGLSHYGNSLGLVLKPVPEE